MERMQGSHLTEFSESYSGGEKPVGAKNLKDYITLDTMMMEKFWWLSKLSCKIQIYNIPGVSKKCTNFMMSYHWNYSCLQTSFSNLAQLKIAYWKFLWNYFNPFKFFMDLKFRKIFSPLRKCKRTGILKGLLQSLTEKPIFKRKINKFHSFTC